MKENEVVRKRKYGFFNPCNADERVTGIEVLHTHCWNFLIRKAKWGRFSDLQVILFSHDDF